MAIRPISARNYTALRVTLTAVPLLLILGISAAAFLFFPPFSDVIKQAIQNEGQTFKWVLIAVGLATAVPATIVAARIFWRASAIPDVGD